MCFRFDIFAGGFTGEYIIGAPSSVINDDINDTHSNICPSNISYHK